MLIDSMEANQYDCILSRGLFIYLLYQIKTLTVCMLTE